jgi:hypothetical protein
MNVWSDIATLERAARLAPYVFLVLGFLVALAGQVVKSTLEGRIGTLRTVALTDFKRTPPKMVAYLAKSEQTGELLVVIDAENLIPFRAHWAIVTERKAIVAGIMLQDQEIHPSDERRRFSAKAGINQDQIVNEYVELRFGYESLYSSELANPPELRGEIVQRYRLKQGNVYDWDDHGA